MRYPARFTGQLDSSQETGVFALTSEFVTRDSQGIGGAIQVFLYQKLARVFSGASLAPTLALLQLDGNISR